MIVKLLEKNSKLHLKRTCAAIGIFDGVHRGHQYLIKQMTARAQALKAKPIVITFFPHPAHVLRASASVRHEDRPDLKLGYLSSLNERMALLKDLGVAYCIVVPFNKAFARIQPEKFIDEILVQQLGVKALFVGQDFCFGKDRSGNTELLEHLSRQYGYEMHTVPALKQGKTAISSSRIRQLLGAGKLNEAAKLLGRDVSLSGKVVKGAQRGKGLGFPTANVAYEADQLLPTGVYIVRAVLGPKEYPAIANIGTRPSFDTQISKAHLEVHLFDFSKNIYGKQMQVKFLKKLRNEKKFPNPQRLIQQIQKDISAARKYF